MEAQSLTHTVVYTYNGHGVRRAVAVDGLVAYWTQDTDGLAEVLIEHTPTGATLYLLGLSRLAQVEGSQAEWFLGDALGSVRQLVDDDGVVVLARDYDPYGQVLAQEGTGSSGYGFTGEQGDEITGLLFLRARWMDPESGRFLSQDTWEGSVQQPSSLHKYLYVSNDPANQRDPSGHAADDSVGTGGIDPRDLTDWLYRELKHNVNDPIVVSLRKQNEAAASLTCDSPTSGVGGVIKINALWTFRNQVKNGARWDLKDEIGHWIGPGFTLCVSGACFNDIELSVPGNIFFSYIGRAAGFSSAELRMGAGWADITDPSHKKRHEEYVGPYEGKFDPSLGLGQWNWGDEPKDHEAVLLGIRLWDNYDNLTRSQFETELANSIGKLAHKDPRAEPVLPNVAKDWPYPVGYFNNTGYRYTGEEGK